MKAKLAALFALQQLDTAIDALKKHYAALDSGKAEQAVYQAATAEHKEAEAALHAVSGALRDTELEVKSVDEKRAAYETKLYSGSVRNPKELQSMQDEIEMLSRLRGKLDEKVLSLMDQLESSRTGEAAAKQTLAQSAVALKAKQEAYKKEAETLIAQARVLAAQRQEAAKQVDAALMQRYDKLRAIKNGLAIVPLEDGNACGGCKMGLSSSLVKRVLAGETIETCDNCKRILCAKE